MSNTHDIRKQREREARMEGSGAGYRRGVRLISCDEVAWLLDIADRYIPRDNRPSVSRQRDMLKYGMLYEIMEVCGLRFEDDAARRNGTPGPAQKYEEAANSVIGAAGMAAVQGVGSTG